MNHNNGWFVLRTDIPAGVTAGAVRWLIEPSVVPGWTYKPVVQTSQVGYLPVQQKVAIIETDPKDTALASATLVRYDADGETAVKTAPVTEWEGDFLRYNYLKADFSDVSGSGLYRLKYGDSASPVFRIGDDIYDRGVWQPVIEYFLPVQMCHMRVTEKYRVWHDACHMDDARMAPVGNHIDGYVQPEGLTPYNALDIVEGLNAGGWHDAGDYDLRVESQSGECYILAMAWEAFHPEIDATAIDQKSHRVEIHEADGRNDILQQVEHGALSVVGSYLALGRLYRGIICNNLRQYVLLGDAAAMTDGVIGNDDDRWVFTENNPGRELSTAANLAASARVLRGFNDTLAVHCEAIAREIFASTEAHAGSKLQPAAELYLTTGDSQYLDFILAKEYPEIFAPDQVVNALNFILGCHPGINQASFAGGVGAQSTTVGYGLNRADWSYIPGGVVSGTALIRPDYPELLEFPYLWQQVEYVLGGGSSHYMFLVLAVKDLLQ